MVLSLAVMFMSFECTGVYGKGVKIMDLQNSPGGNKKRSRPEPDIKSDGGVCRALLTRDEVQPAYVCILFSVLFEFGVVIIDTLSRISTLQMSQPHSR